MSHLTTHILDTAKGKPVNGVHVYLYMYQKHDWVEVARGMTNEDGRVPDLLKKGTVLQLGTYKLRFDTRGYYSRLSIETFYPSIEISFYITTEEHYHVPLLLSPFGYSTYRGS